MNKNNNVISRRVSKIELIMLCAFFFPWLSFGLNQMDSQPWSFVICLIYIFASSKFYLRNDLKILSVIVIFSCFLMVLLKWDEWILLIRSLTGYFQILLVILCSFNLMAQKKEILKILIYINYVWLFVALLQYFVNPFLFEFLVAVRTSEGRGVTGLAPEPTYFAVYIITINWIIIGEFVTKFGSIRNANLILLCTMNVLSIIFLAKSSMGILYLSVALALWVILKTFASIKNMFWLAIVFILMIIFAQYMEFILPEESRILDVLTKILSDPLLLLEIDESINQRLSHVYYSIGGFWDGFAIPRGISDFVNYYEIASGEYRNFFWSVPGDKIMSWAGQIIFELGILGLIIYVVILRMFWGKRQDLHINLFALGFFIVFSFSAIPHGFSPLAVLIGFYAASSLGGKNKSHIKFKFQKLGLR